MARTSSLTNVATVTRATKAWYPGGWDFTNGGAITGDLVEYANNIPRDGAQGLLVEEASTNHIRNPRAEGAVAGTPGTDPTNWAVGTFAGITKEVVGIGEENGHPYFEVRYNGTATNDCSIDLEGAAAVAALNGETWTVSCGVKLVSGSLSNISQVRLFLIERDSGGNATALTGVATASIDGTHRRFHGTHTLAGGGGTAYVQPRLALDRVANGAIDITLRIYAPQLEKKAYPTSPILPPASSPAASTRNVDDVIIDIGAWFNSDNSSFYVSFQQAGEADGMLAYFSDGTFNERFQLRKNVSTQVNLGVWNSGTQTGNASISGVSSTVGDTFKCAAAVAADDIALSVNGQTQVTDSTVALPTGLTSLQLGFDGLGIEFNGYFKEFRYWPRRLTNAELEALVGN